jgi:Spy/CpxP family protein refolding chaperone
MRKSTFINGLGLALVLGAGVAVSAQPPAAGRPSAGAADSTHRGRRGPEGLLLRGITLTDAQQQQVATLREQQRERMRAAREQSGAGRGADRTAAGANGAPRRRPDSATLAARRKQFDEQRTRDEAALRALLTPEQRKQFDANKAELEQRMRERQAQGGFGGGRGGDREQWRGRQG